MSFNAEQPLLEPDTVTRYLQTRGLARDGERPRVESLDGGVSNLVYAVALEAGSVVVKQALPQLRVAEPWFAKRERALNEAAALGVADSAIPRHVPRVVDVDAETCTLVIERAPTTWRTWKTDLLTGQVSLDVAAEAGSVLGNLHAATSLADGLDERFDDLDLFEQLRIEPYYRVAAERNPSVAALVDEPIVHMLATRPCLVHGDFSPKNLLVGDGGLWLIDFEVAHRGDPAFDVAFMLTHLLLKWIHVERARDSLREATETFNRSYATAAGALAPPESSTVNHLGWLLLARVDGRSPAEYLDADGRKRARETALGILLQRPKELSEVWALIEDG